MPKKLTANAFVGYSPISAVGNGMNDWNIRNNAFSHTIA